MIGGTLIVLFCVVLFIYFMPIKVSLLITQITCCLCCNVCLSSAVISMVGKPHKGGSLVMYLGEGPMTAVLCCDIHGWETP